MAFSWSATKLAMSLGLMLTVSAVVEMASTSPLRSWMVPREAVMMLDRVCWLTALLSSSSCRRICRSKSFQKSSRKVATPKIAISHTVLPRITWLARRTSSLFLRFLASAMRISFPESSVS